MQTMAGGLIMQPTLTRLSNQPSLPVLA